MVSLILHYVLFVFVAAAGTIQVSAAHAGLRGLLVLPSRWGAGLLGCGLIVGSFAWFFGLVDRNVRGLEGLEQALLFVPSAAAAVAATVVVSSLVRRRASVRRLAVRGVRARPRLKGLEALRSRSYFEVLLGDSEKAAR